MVRRNRYLLDRCRLSSVAFYHHLSKLGVKGVRNLFCRRDWDRPRRRLHVWKLWTVTYFWGVPRLSFLVPGSGFQVPGSAVWLFLPATGYPASPLATPWQARLPLGLARGKPATAVRAARRGGALSFGAWGSRFPARRVNRQAGGTSRSARWASRCPCNR